MITTTRLGRAEWLTVALVVLPALAVGYSIGSGSPARAALLAVALPALYLAFRLPAYAIVAAAFAGLPFPLAVQGLGGLSLHVILVPGVIALLWLLRSEGTRTRDPLLKGLLLGLLGAALVSAVVNGLDGDQGMALFLFVTGAAFCLTVTRVCQTQPHIELAVRSFVASVTLMGGAALLQLVTGRALLPGLRGGIGETQELTGGGTQIFRLAGPLGDYELFAEILAIAALLAIWLIPRAGRRGKIVLVGALLLLVGALVTTGTRGGLIQLAVGLALLILLGRQLRLGVLAGLVTIAGGAYFALDAFGRFGAGSIFARLNLLSGQAPLAALANSRAEIWSIFTGPLGESVSFWVGAGPHFAFDVHGIYPHSLYVYLTFTIGIVGATLFCAVLLSRVLVCLRAGVRNPHTPSLVLGCALASFAINEVKIEFFRVASYQLLIWGLIGLATAASRVSREHG